MKKLYEAPAFEIEVFDVEDAITLSGVDDPNKVDEVDWSDL